MYFIAYNQSKEDEKVLRTILRRIFYQELVNIGNIKTYHKYSLSDIKSGATHNQFHMDEMNTSWLYYKHDSERQMSPFSTLEWLKRP